MTQTACVVAHLSRSPTAQVAGASLCGVTAAHTHPVLPEPVSHCPCPQRQPLQCHGCACPLPSCWNSVRPVVALRHRPHAHRAASAQLASVPADPVGQLLAVKANSERKKVHAGRKRRTHKGVGAFREANSERKQVHAGRKEKVHSERKRCTQKGKSALRKEKEKEKKKLDTLKGIHWALHLDRLCKSSVLPFCTTTEGGS